MRLLWSGVRRFRFWLYLCECHFAMALPSTVGGLHPVLSYCLTLDHTVFPRDGFEAKSVGL
jgi:hypothetical protein